MDIRELSSLIDRRIADNCQLITPSDIGRPFLLHVSREKIHNDTFIPGIPKSIGSGEDKHFPRVNVCNTLIDCINAMADLQEDFSKDISGKDANKYYIYAIPFEYALKPNIKLVHDADFTNETWLFTHSPETKNFKGYITGEFYVTSIKTTPVKGKHDLVYNEKLITINCFSNDTINVDEDHEMKNWFSFSFQINRSAESSNLSMTDSHTYNTMRGLVSSLEHQQTAPSWLGWK